MTFLHDNVSDIVEVTTVHVPERQSKALYYFQSVLGGGLIHLSEDVRRLSTIPLFGMCQTSSETFPEYFM